MATSKSTTNVRSIRPANIETNRGGAAMNRRPWRMLIERDVAEIERRLELYRRNSPKRIAAEMGVHQNTVTIINLQRHPIQLRLATERVRA